MPDFRAAIAQLPAELPRRHHGRDFGGVDCLGLFFLIYRLAGLAVDDIDLPYSERDQIRPHRCALVRQRLLLRFEEVPVTGVWRDGDVLMVGDARHNHLAVHVGGFIYQMTTALEKVPAARLSPLVWKAFRLAAP